MLGRTVRASAQTIMHVRVQFHLGGHTKRTFLHLQAREQWVKKRGKCGGISDFFRIFVTVSVQQSQEIRT